MEFRKIFCIDRMALRKLFCMDSMEWKLSDKDRMENRIWNYRNRLI
jgi:hypothetical protein